MEAHLDASQTRLGMLSFIIRLPANDHPCSLLHLRILGLSQAVLLEERIDLIGAPEVVVDLARFRPPDRRELDCTRLANAHSTRR